MVSRRSHSCVDRLDCVCVAPRHSPFSLSLSCVARLARPLDSSRTRRSTSSTLRCGSSTRRSSRRLRASTCSGGSPAKCVSKLFASLDIERCSVLMTLVFCTGRSTANRTDSASGSSCGQRRRARWPQRTSSAPSWCGRLLPTCRGPSGCVGRSSHVVTVCVSEQAAEAFKALGIIHPSIPSSNFWPGACLFALSVISRSLRTDAPWCCLSLSMVLRPCSGSFTSGSFVDTELVRHGAALEPEVLIDCRLLEVATAKRARRGKW